MKTFILSVKANYNLKIGDATTIVNAIVNDLNKTFRDPGTYSAGVSGDIVSVYSITDKEDEPTFALVESRIMRCNGFVAGYMAAKRDLNQE